MYASNAALYGKGIFTTVAIYDRGPFLWEKHWRRLTDNAARIGIDISDYPEETTRRSLDETIEKNGVIDGRARITFSDESPSTIWSADTDGKTRLQIITGEERSLPENARIALSPFPVNSRSPLAGVKSCNYLENLLVVEDAKSNGFDEAIRLNERGLITSVCMANVFWLKDARIYTPSLKTGCLAGTTREFVLENLTCDEVEVDIEELGKADAIFLTSAGIGIAAIDEFNGKRFESLDHPILKLL